MGVRGHLTEIAPELLNHVLAGKEPELPNAPCYRIDKAWHNFHIVFRTKGPPLSQAIAGDCLHPQISHTFDDFLEGGYDYFVGFASTNLVQQVAEALSSLTAVEFERWQREAVDGQYPCREELENLKTAYREAAANKNSLVILIC